MKNVFVVSAFFFGGKGRSFDAYKAFGTLAEAKAYYKAWMNKVILKRGGKFVHHEDPMLTWPLKGSGMRAVYNDLTIQGYLSVEDAKDCAQIGKVEIKRY